jgi:hypothetical protein
MVFVPCRNSVNILYTLSTTTAGIGLVHPNHFLRRRCSQVARLLPLSNHPYS